MHLPGTTARALAEQEALRRDLFSGPRKALSPYTHLLSVDSPLKRASTLDRALSLGVLAPLSRKNRR